MTIEQIFLFTLEMIGTVAFAISGIRMSAAKHFDWFGAYTVGLVTAIGGGTLRDLMLDCPVFWMSNFWYLGVTGLSLVAVIALKKYLLRLSTTIFIFDTIGLAMFVVIGVQKTLLFGHPMWLAILMGTITGALGGILRDILINDVPLIFRKDVYATACIAGGFVYWLMMIAGFNEIVQGSACAVTVIAVRLLAVHYGWSIPMLRNFPDDNDGGQ